ncbi:hypothetical protein B0F90DRAFT_1702700 [Multifurca ochricompacta]|uniref:RING-type domain-containing protein n=1 Tax=Multifurca ochricompacta TaxID=376703 RepID=A0AAD4M854_9AGAM|nr:hypothetical protein B0F90DRAFT_1702700 [Multifurca ochricompacta]
MPVCPHPPCPCGHKNVPAEVLINHVQSSRWAALYFCGICRCVCRSEAVLIFVGAFSASLDGFSAVPSQQPQATSSTPCTCHTCDRVYSSASALEQHYRDFPVHPKCARCNIGFANNAAIQAHVVSVHRPITCSACNGLQVYQEDVAHHYKTSPKHPSCTVCDSGFENKESFDEHMSTRHPEFRCRTCNICFVSTALLEAHYQESPKHPRCPECQLSFEDNLALIKMSLHDAFSDASIVSRASRSPSIARSVRNASIKALTPTRSVASPIPFLQSHFSVPPTIVSHGVSSGRDIPEGILSASSRSSTASISSPSLISRVPSISDHNLDLELLEGRAETISNLESVHQGMTTPPRRSTSLSASSSHSTRSIVAASETDSPVSAALSIFGRAPSITSIPQAQAPSTVLFSSVAVPRSVDLGEASSTKGSLAETARSRASSFMSTSIDRRKGGPQSNPGAASPSLSTKTASPPPNHVVFPSPGQRERFRIAPANNTPRADSLPKSHDSERFHSPEPELPRRLSPIEKVSKVERQPVEKPLPSPTPVVEASCPDTQLRPDLAHGERLVSYVYCRLCRRDPCRQPAATMCGHIFCHQCISSEVIKTSRCPVCEAPTLLYSIFRLHFA